jgi:Flp pilus assembly protein TadG
VAPLTPRPRWHGERGAELIEMVVVLPLLMLVLFGIIDFGFMFQRYVVLTNAAMEGARVGILPGYDAADAKARAETYAEAGGLPSGTAIATPVQVALPEPGGGTWPAIEVTVNHTYTYQFIGPIVSMFGGTFSTVNLTARATMRRQIGS